MGGRWLALLLVLVLAGCSRVIDDARPRAETPVAPIAAGQVADLLSKRVRRGNDGNLFVTVEPQRCAGVAREVDSPFVFDAKPVAHDGGHWDAGGGRSPSIEEMVGVYRADFDAAGAIERAAHDIESCRDQTMTVTAMRGEVIDARLLPQVASGSPRIVFWSFAARSWACDNAFVAAHNAAIEITACAATNGYDVATLARDALARIETLANRVA
ncbi:sensor domain-containing protein [Mycolicibacterium sp. 050158]|uniref:sensor domain-containing protein n=1 Tax=Mycolicibacterium sp. 050158 TaxID=3090602 RepID=UPI00299D2EAE|nr:sensor domain-containing protein [Mycolicibacterium sp. 050158]MDX1889980.1 sensor domain-containing protein [Mycolicibacterium sp. 050158]